MAGRTTDIISRIMVLIGQALANSNWASSEADARARILAEINDGYRKIAEAHDWRWLLKEELKNIPYTTTSDVGESTGTNIYVTSSDDIYAGQRLIIGDSIFEPVTVSSLPDEPEDPLVLSSPGIFSSYEDDEEAEIGAASVQKPTDFWKLESVILNYHGSNINTAEPLIRTTHHDFDVNTSPKLGMPTHYVEEQNSIIFNCGVDDSYTYRANIRYFKNITALAVSSTDTVPEFSLYYDDLLVNYGIFSFYQRIGDANGYQFYKFKFEERLKQMISEASINYDGNPVIRAAIRANREGLR